MADTEKESILATKGFRTSCAAATGRFLLTTRELCPTEQTLFLME